MADQPNSWGKDLKLDGFTYETIVYDGTISTKERLDWLDKQEVSMSGLSGTGEGFRHQPWKQLQKSFREMGHIEAAKQVAVAYQHRLRKANLIGTLPTNEPALKKWVYRKLIRFLHWSHWVLSGYGYKPLRVLFWSIPIWLFCGAFYWFVALPDQNVFSPTNPLVFQNEDYKDCRPKSDKSLSDAEKERARVSADPEGNWYLCGKLKEEYTGFSPLAYSLDVILPLVDLQQQKDWGPMVKTPQASWWRELSTQSWGHATRLVIWLETLLGWFFGLWLASSVSGFVKPRETE